MNESQEADQRRAYEEGYRLGYADGLLPAHVPFLPLPGSATMPRPAAVESSFWLGYHHGRHHASTGEPAFAAVAASLVPDNLEAPS